ncbi:MAG: phosphatase PAP2 family protein [Bacteroidetes bacterium]|nr:phosphatase PAP2 family protein [Bacteroidota bacterium]
MRTIFCFFVTLLVCVNVFCFPADSLLKISDSALKPIKTKVYRVNYFVEGSIIAVGMVGDFFAIPRLKSKAPLSDEELLFANTDEQKNLINSVDKWALKQQTSDRAIWKKVSDYGEIGIFLLPSLLMIDKNIRKDWLHLLFMYVEGHTVTFTFYNYSPLGPYFQNRYRPAVYYPELGADAQKNSNNRNSFYSGHVASCAYSTFFMVKVYCDYHPNIGAVKYLLYLAASVPPLFMGYARIRSLDHFPSDDAVGFALGAIIGIVVPALHKIPCSKYLSVGMSTSPDVVGVNVAWKLDYKRLLTSGR